MKENKRAALLIAHPGHELRIHGWLEAVRPLVFITTDGSGASGIARTAKSADTLRAAGCRSGAVFGRFTDVNMYDFILHNDVERVVSMTGEIAGSLADAGVESAVADAVEFYNPVHDLSRVILSLAIERVRQMTGREIEQFEFAVVNSPEARAPNDVVVNLDEAAWQRKIDAAFRYTELQGETDKQFRANGTAAFRTERLHVVDPSAAFPEPDDVPYYEVRGEEQVRSGRYAQVLRHRPHFREFVEELSSAFRTRNRQRLTSFA